MIELLSNFEMGAADRLTIAGGTPGFELMQHAGMAVAEAVAATCPAGGVVGVVTGSGNNGGDGFVAARLLRDRGYKMRVLALGDVAKLKGDAAQAHSFWGEGVEGAAPNGLAGVKVIVDAIFGAGLDRPVEGRARAMIEAMNAAPATIVAVDLPSGICGDTGEVLGAAVMARKTVTFFRRKPGHVLLPGRLHCGDVRVADIGIKADVLAPIAPRTFANAPALWRDAFPVPALAGHKYSRGHAVVVSGGASYTGAARLAARGALRAGAGLSTIASPREALPINAAANLAVMVRAVDGAAELTAFLSDHRFNAVAIGPGGGVGPHTRDMTLAALAGERAVVADADALTSFGADPELLFSAIQAHPQRTAILTPHAGEFARLFGRLPGIAEVHGKLEQARRAAAVSGAVVVLKGADTVVAHPSGRAVVNVDAPPTLATAGTGDTLAGIVAGLMVQRMAPFAAAAAGVWIHGAAARAAGRALIAEDLADALGPVLAALDADAG
ncbi:MAG: NAD(P)H-hydrate dehydratase [Acetobacteraceae bacterium]|nr:NAD(P)H-hydrate dehydratase [Acetobacteraceae bacterium]